MKKKQRRIIVGILLGVLAALLGGAMLDFYPFLGDDLIVREVQFCTFVICAVMVLCTCIIISNHREE